MRKVRSAMGRFVLGLAAVWSGVAGGYASGEETTIRLDSWDFSRVRQGWGEAQRSLSVQGNPITIGGRRFESGVGTHANGSLVVDLEGGLEGGPARFLAWVGVDDEIKGHPGSVEFRVIGDGKELWKSGVMKVGDAARSVEVGLKGVRVLELVVTDGGDGIDSDHADWADAKLVGEGLKVAYRAYLTVWEPVVVRPGWTAVGLDQNMGGKTLQIGERRFARGLGMAAGSDVIFSGLGGRFERFESWVGVDAESEGKGSVRFRVLVDGELRYESPVVRGGEAGRFVSVPVAGGGELRLVVDDGGDGDAGDHADWGGAVLVGRGDGMRRMGPVGETVMVRTEGIAVEVNREGEVIGVVLQGKGARRKAAGRTHLAGCRVEGPVACKTKEGGGVEFVKTLVDQIGGGRCRLVERFMPSKDSVRWEVAIEGEGGPWSTAIETGVRWPEPKKARFWTAWADNRHRKASGWSDPLVPAGFDNMRLWYGAPAYRETTERIGYCPFLYDVFCIPIATIIEEQEDVGVSLVLSPEDTMLDMVLATDSLGSITISRMNHRISKARPVRFAMDLAAHAGDWRCGLAWMAERYPEYFEPKNPKAHEVAGCGAYSTHEGELDVEKLRRMAFRVNWKASYDFPFMGMFLPPVADDEEWVNFRKAKTSIRQLNDYARRMREMGFFVLSYFNVTEFGAGVEYPPPPRKAAKEADLWRDANDFLYGRLGEAILYGPGGRPYGTWGGAVAMDPGEPAYQEYLLGQARRHVEKVPASSGICIDRMDWLRLYNDRADDGVSWRNGKPVRSLLMSWREIMSKLGPLMHGADKAIFVNNHIKRFEQLREVDGIYDEFTYHPAAINTCGLLGVRKPVLGWTAGPQDLKPDPDAFFQRYLHMGIFPTAPFPWNDHTINPDEWAERFYVDYGPLLEAMRGKRWVLRAHAVEVEGGSARVNLFEVPGGYAMPVTFARPTERVKVVVRDGKAAGVGAPVCEAIHPGEGERVPVPAKIEEGLMRLEVPVRRGCAMVCIRAATGNRGS